MISLMQGDCLERMKEIPRHGYGVSDMNVLSLFDGMSCGQIALERAGIHVDNYFASEIDKYAMKVTKANYPNTRHIGGVVDVRGEDLPGIDLLIGGSPCQGFSSEGKRLNFDDPRSKLFFEFVRILKETKPKYFLLENVRMKKEYQDIISEHLGVEPICINSALVSAQNRVRYYWTNIPGIEQPEDKGLLLKDILEGCGQKVGRIVGRKSYFEKHRRQLVFKLSSINPRVVDVSITNEGIRPHRNDERKSGLSEMGRLLFKDAKKAYCVTAAHVPKVINDYRIGKNYVQYDLSGKGHNSQDQRAFYKDGKHGTLPSNGGASKVKYIDENFTIRKLTPTECERLQTVPDNYTDHVSNTQRYKMLGNGWTVDVIAHILRGMDL